MEASAGDPARSGVVALIEESKWSPLQKWVLLLASVAVIFDGIDNLLLGIAIPSLMTQWGHPRDAFIATVAISIAAMCLGTFVFGASADRFGRRPVLIASVVIFGGATLAGGLADSLTTFTACRLVAAIGLGGAFPTATALISEFTPARMRSTAVASAILCVPIGGILAGLLGAQLLPAFGWRSLFILGGAPALVVALLMALTLPESPVFLQGRGGDPERLRRLLARCSIAWDGSTAAAAAAKPGRVSLGAILANGRGPETLALWAVLFCNSLAVYAVFNWWPTLLKSTGFDASQSALAISAFNCGGVVGALLGGRLMDRIDLKRPPLIFAAAGAVMAGVLALLGWPASDGWALGVGMIGLGLFCCGLQPMLYALAASLYPADLRGKGVGAATGIGRLGAIGSAMVGASALAMDVPRFLCVLTLALGLAALALFAIRPAVAAPLRQRGAPS